jgi:hypothetical protein
MDRRDDDDAMDLLWGVRSIAREIGRSEKQTYYLLGTRQIPGQKVGGKWCGSRLGYRRFFRQVVHGEPVEEEAA